MNITNETGNNKFAIGLLSYILKFLSDTIYYIIFIWILCIILLFQRIHITDWVRREFLLPNWLLLMLFLAGTAILCLLNKFAKTSRLNCIIRFLFYLPKNHLIQLSFAVFTVMAFISYCTFFLTGWDAGEEVVSSAALAASGEALPPNKEGYFSWYTNNALLYCIYRIVFSLTNPFLSLEYQLYIIIIIQCIISVSTLILVYLFVRDCTESTVTGCISWWLTVALVGTSPWVSITYSDALGVIFPVASLRVYQRLRQSSRPYFYWILLFFLCYWSYRVKATTGIVLVAVIICEIFRWLKHLDLHTTVAAIGKILLLITVFMISEALFVSICGRSGIYFDEEKGMSALHYLMLGLNEEADGAFNFPDVDFSMFISDKKNRESKERDEAISRVKEMWPERLFAFEMRKTLVNFHDGTFAYGIEGNFYMDTFSDRNGLIETVLKNIFWDSGKYYPYLASFQQSIWLGVVFFCTLMKPSGHDSTYTLRLCLTGIFVFVMLFEARARYLYCFAPLYTSGAAIGYAGVYGKFSYRLNNN